MRTQRVCQPSRVRFRKTRRRRRRCSGRAVVWAHRHTLPHHLEASETSSLLWSIGKLLHSTKNSQALCSCLASLIEKAISYVQGMASVDSNCLLGAALARDSARLGSSHDEKSILEGKIQLLAQRASDRLSDEGFLETCSTSQIPLLVHSLARLDCDISHVEPLKMRIMQSMGSFHAQNIGMLAWGFAKSCASRDKKFGKCLLSRALEVKSELSWASCAHLEYFIAQQQRMISKTKSKKLLNDISDEILPNHFSALAKQISRKEKAARREVLSLLKNILPQLSNGKNAILIVDGSEKLIKKIKKMAGARHTIVTWNRFSCRSIMGEAWPVLANEAEVGVAVVCASHFQSATDMCIGAVAAILP